MSLCAYHFIQVLQHYFTLVFGPSHHRVLGNNVFDFGGEYIYFFNTIMGNNGNEVLLMY